MFNIDKRTLLIILGIFLALYILSSGTAGILATLLTLPGVLIAITFHEFAHAFVAYKLGDETPKLQGRINLNPLSHIDPVGFLFLIIAGFGWGKPVEINSRNFNGKYSLSKAEAIVAAAGPIMNLLLGFVFMIIFYLIFFATNLAEGLTTNAYTALYYVLYGIVSVNIGLGIFNLIPVPPLDGSKILMHFLPYNAKQWFYDKEQIFYLVFIILWVTDLLSVILSPIFAGVGSGMFWLASKIVSIFI